LKDLAPDVWQQRKAEFDDEMVSNICDMPSCRGEEKGISLDIGPFIDVYVRDFISGKKTVEQCCEMLLHWFPKEELEDEIKTEDVLKTYRKNDTERHYELLKALRERGIEI